MTATLESSQESKVKIQELIAQNKIREALEALRKRTRKTSYEDKVLQLQSVFRKNELDYHQGIIQVDTYRKEFSRMLKFLLYLVDELENEENQVQLFEHTDELMTFVSLPRKDSLPKQLENVVLVFALIIVFAALYFITSQPILLPLEAELCRCLIAVGSGVLFYGVFSPWVGHKSVSFQNRIVIFLGLSFGVYFANIPCILNNTYGKIGPSNGLAYGYFYNFVKPVTESLHKNVVGEIKVNGKALSSENFVFMLFVPETLDKGIHNAIYGYIREYNLDTVNVSVLHRNYTLYGKKRGNCYFFIDFPTTTLSLSNYIENIGGGKCQEGCQSEITQYEIAEFKKALQTYMHDYSFIEKAVRIEDLNRHNLALIQ